MDKEILKRQILAIRDIGCVNMFDAWAVRDIAKQCKFTELAAYLGDRKNWESYGRFILNGEELK
jgi:hypothetical protein